MPRFRPRISILNALLLMTIVAMAIVIVQFWREIGPLRYDVNRLRTEQGLIVVEDEGKVHAIQLQSLDESVWKFRVYVPRGTVQRVYLTVNQIPAKNVPEFKRWSGSSVLGYSGDMVYADLIEGEHILTVGVYRDQQGGRCVGFERQGPGSPPLSSRRSYGDEKWPRRTYQGAYVSGIPRATRQADSNGTLVLIRYRATDNTSTQWPDVDLGKPVSDGFLLWIEPSPSKALLRAL